GSARGAGAALSLRGSAFGAAGLATGAARGVGAFAAGAFSDFTCVATGALAATGFGSGAACAGDSPVGTAFACGGPSRAGAGCLRWDGLGCKASTGGGGFALLSSGSFSRNTKNATAAAIASPISAKTTPRPRLRDQVVCSQAGGSDKPSSARAIDP